MINGAVTSADLFSVLSVKPMLGRTFATAEDKPNEAGRVVVLTERLFASRFNWVIGLYGVMSYSVAQRTNEIGIRMALGAQTRDVLSLIVKDGVKIVSIGLLIGIGGALALTRLLETLLFGVATRDPLTFIFIAGLLSLVAMLACCIPALRATRVDPLEALRCE